jgi:hypothetical protein
MSADQEHALDQRLKRFEDRLPAPAAKVVGWVRSPSSRMVRLPVGIALTAGGVVGFLPVVGFWMLPVGLALIAKDIPPLRPPLVRLFDWVERKLPEREPVKSD